MLSSLPLRAPAVRRLRPALFTAAGSPSASASASALAPAPNQLAVSRLSRVQGTAFYSAFTDRRVEEAREEIRKRDGRFMDADSGSSGATSAAPHNIIKFSGGKQLVDVDALRQVMIERPRRSTYDFLSPTHDHLLNLALWDALPPEARAGHIPPEDATTRFTDRFMLPSHLSRGKGATVLPHGHHLVYFPLQKPLSLLLPDGTDPAQSPGAPFVRRMWAGGYLRYKYPQRLKMDGSRAVCVERIDPSTLRVRGAPGQERIFVDIWRKYGPTAADIHVRDFDKWALKDIEDEVEADPAVEERRTLVFMRGKSDVPKNVDPLAKEKKIKGQEEKIVKAPHAPEYSFKMTPTTAMLFQFSALTYNAHSIHLDPQYCREVEGHRGLLVHGPLSMVLMLAAVRAKVSQVLEDDKNPREFNARSIYSFEYRNLAPLYAGEELKVCVRRHPLERLGRRGRFFKWDVWIENHLGGLCVKGTAVTRGKPSKLSEHRDEEFDELDELGSIDEFDKAFNTF